MNAHATKQENPNWAELARSSLEIAHGDAALAATKFVESLMRDQALLEAACPAALRNFAQEQISQCFKHRRAERPSEMKVIPINGSTFNAAVRANFDRYMSRPVWGGKPISDCTGAELRESAERYSKQGSAMIREATWEFAVADALETKRKTNEQTVSQVLDESSLSILWESSTDD